MLNKEESLLCTSCFFWRGKKKKFTDQRPLKQRAEKKKRTLEASSSWLIGPVPVVALGLLKRQ